MARSIQQLRFFPLLVLVAITPRPAPASQPTTCVNPSVMRDEFRRFVGENGEKSFLTDATGIRGSDSLYNHVTDFSRSGIGHHIDPRLPAAIAGIESTYGTVEGRCDHTTDNPWNLMDKVTGKICEAYGEITGSIAGVSIDLDNKVNVRGCNTLADYRARYTKGPGGPRGELQVVRPARRTYADAQCQTRQPVMHVLESVLQAHGHLAGSVYLSVRGLRA